MEISPGELQAAIPEVMPRYGVKSNRRSFGSAYPADDKSSAGPQTRSAQDDTVFCELRDAVSHPKRKMRV